MGKVDMAKKQEGPKEEEEENTKQEEEEEIKQLREILEMLTEKLKESGIDIEYDIRPLQFTLNFGMIRGSALIKMGIRGTRIVFEGNKRRIVLTKYGEQNTVVDFEFYPEEDKLIIKINRGGEIEEFEFDHVELVIDANAIYVEDANDTVVNVVLIFYHSVSAKHYEW